MSCLLAILCVDVENLIDWRNRHLVPVRTGRRLGKNLGQRMLKAAQPPVTDPWQCRKPPVVCPPQHWQRRKAAS